jgi:hypothetical protein
MFGTWIAEIQTDLHKHFPATGDYKPVDFKREPMPASVSHFLEHALARRAAMVEVSIDSVWFGVTEPDVVESENHWRKMLAASARYPSSLWDQSIDQAVTYIVSFLVSPADSFCDFVFANTERDVHPRKIIQRIAYFQPYSSLRKVLKEYAERKGNELVSREDLRAAILKADRALVADYGPSDWITQLHPLYELARVLTAGDAAPEVPTSVLKPVFESKGAEELLRRIEAIESIGGHRKLSESSIIKALGPTEIEPEPEVVAPVGEQEPVEVPPPLRLNDTHATSSTKVVPRWMHFTNKIGSRVDAQSGDGGSLIPEPEVAGELTESEAIPMPSRVGERARLPEDLIDAAVAVKTVSQTPDTSAPAFGDMNSVQCAWFVNNLFGGDTEEFSRVVSLLDSAIDWETAAHLIGVEVFERYNVDIYGQPAIEFTNAVESRYL